MRQLMEDEVDMVEDGVVNFQRKLKQQKNETQRLLRVLKRLLTTTTTTTAKPVRAIPVLVIACNRPQALKNHLDQLLRLRPSKEEFPVIVSQDCAHTPTTNVIDSYGDEIFYVLQPDQSDMEVPMGMKKFKVYYKLSRHYKFALNHVFSTGNYDSVIVTEDDLDIAPDFFQYFSATNELLLKDEFLWCVSAWNDNGKVPLINPNEHSLLHRTDFFPGLGWLLRRDLWVELEKKWPKAFWDDWMREPAQRKGRHCIRPEVSRTSMSLHGAKGASHGLWYEQHLKHIILNQHSVDFGKLDLSHLLKDNYDQRLKEILSTSSIVTKEELSSFDSSKQPENISFKIIYKNAAEFHGVAAKFNLMNDFRSGVPRTAYKGVVSFMYKDWRVYLVPGWEWTDYNSKWN